MPGLRGSRDGGAASVEFAIVLPLLLLVVFGVIDLGRALNTQIGLTHATREGVRASELGRTDVEAVVRDTVGPLVTVTSVTVTSCPTPPTAGSTTTVRATARVDFVTPLGAFLPGAPDGVTVTGVGVARCLA
jgi:Flp pilus assembly protein TadG